MHNDSKLIFEAWKGSLLQKSFDKENWSPLVKALEQASFSEGGSDKQIAMANIASNLFNLLAGKEGEVSTEEKRVLEEIGVNLLKLTKSEASSSEDSEGQMSEPEINSRIEGILNRPKTNVDPQAGQPYEHKG